ncbi:RpiB/LacA/LacB family sugar-phosphate isomerase [Erysipelothrix sp. HDW6C]|uniref:RpiB/LacA/LacB family sugar-phosphate isomerase n=1 Tax=Erysipelothrix sp. HDW6C TaxID=2714930 RepID=UPI00140E81D6|nr:RpiB/LacA/LacB family sugar-phosphate isomerase [Erysipelothrix sp. HDW6C]QIK69278.1 RpiB/LacA/LacB family sugar-phosphate isomerase [Erysipelothrix sp. HDW6C]
MKIALINENSQAAKNSIIYTSLVQEAEKKGHTVDNYGMYSNEQEHQLTYVQNGLIASILLTTKAADFVVTGCGTGQGAMLACNSFPNVLCGHIVTPLDAFLFGQVNDGNCVAMPFAQGFGWGAEVNLNYTFEKLFSEPFGGGYPKDRVIPEQRNKKILDSVKAVTHQPLIKILKEIDQDFLKSAINYPEFKDMFFKNSQDQEISNYLKSILD